MSTSKRFGRLSHPIRKGSRYQEHDGQMMIDFAHIRRELQKGRITLVRKEPEAENETAIH